MAQLPAAGLKNGLLINHLLDHVENPFTLVQPDIVVGYGHGLERDLFGVLEVGIGPPDVLQ